MKQYKSWIWIAVAILLYFGIRAMYLRPGYAKGEPAPEFTAELSDGSRFEMSSLRGSYVLVDFWGSWCGPCIKQKPVLQSLYETYHTAEFRSAQGFEIVSIAVEEDAQRWTFALRRLAPGWPYQILDVVKSLRFFDGVLTKKFGVRKLPTSFLLDADGTVLKTNIELDALERFLASEIRN